VHQGLAQLVDPFALVVAHEAHAPRQRVAAAPGDPGVDERVEHLALGQPQPGHHRDAQGGEKLLLVAAPSAPRDLAGEAGLGLIGDTHAQRSGVLPEALDAGAAGKSNTGKGIKMAADKMEANAERKGWDGTIKGSGATGKSINEKGIKRSEDVIVRGWDPVVKQINRLRCADGTCSVEATVEWDGAEYEAVISGVLKTKHDTVKNSIGNIR